MILSWFGTIYVSSETWHLKTTKHTTSKEKSLRTNRMMLTRWKNTRARFLLAIVVCVMTSQPVHTTACPHAKAVKYIYTLNLILKDVFFPTSVLFLLFSTFLNSTQKGFFKRVSAKKDKPRCFFGNECPITPENRNTCKSCRFNKCLKVGMSIEGMYFILFRTWNQLIRVISLYIQI